MKYTAFVSYNSKDDRWARWLQRKLEQYHLPAKLISEKDDERRPKRFRIFRYRSDLNTVSLSQGLSSELDEARWLIVICSPYSAQSEWVGREIDHFISTGRKDHIIPFIVRGAPYSGDNEECFNPVLRCAFPENDILGVNINDYGDDPRMLRKRKALIRTISLLIELPDAYAYLWNRYKLRWLEGLAAKSIGCIVVLSLLLYAWHYNSSYNISLIIDDTTPRSSLLEMPKDAMIVMQLDNEVKRLPVKSTVVFKNIPGQYANKTVHIWFEAIGFEKCDTTVVLKRKSAIHFQTRRDDTFAILSGIVTNEDGMPIADAKITAQGEQTTTSEDGSFLIRIPSEKQTPHPHVIVQKNGYDIWETSELGIGRNWQIVLLRE